MLSPFPPRCRLFQLLLASNDPPISALMTAVLTKAEYHVIAVKSAEAAIAALLDKNGLFALALLDGQQPPISGNHILAAIREAGCQVPVILASGSFIIGERVVTDPKVGLLSKPFHPSDLLRAVEGLLFVA